MIPERLDFTLDPLNQYSGSEMNKINFIIIIAQNKSV